MQPVTPGLRADIQALRGVAILLVLLHHAKLVPLGAGYLGVDIFFVISGFLITGMVKRAIEAHTFSLADFYFRRAKRLLPAACVTFLVTGILAALILDREELRGLVLQMAGAVTFTSNFVLWRQAGYFDSGAVFTPLLHAWSLSIEEQYYLLLPLAMLWSPRRLWLPAMATILAASLGLWLFLGPSRTTAAFYLLPMRGWEIAFGSLVALAGGGNAMAWFARHFFWPALAVLAWITCAPSSGVPDGLSALAVCMATAAVIMRAHESAGGNRAVLALARLGDISYSLYLVHWPLFALANNMYLGIAPDDVRLALLVLSFPLAYLLHVAVERPLWRATGVATRSGAIAMILASAALTLPPAAAWVLSPDGGFESDVRPNRGFIACDLRGPFVPREECRNSPQPRMMVWGDSFAMHLVPGIVQTTAVGVEQVTRARCGPLDGIAPTQSWLQDRRWAEECVRFNAAALEHALRSPSIEVVVLSSRLSQYLKGRIWVPGNGRLVEERANHRAALDALRRSVARLRAAGKRVILVAPPPSAGWNIAKCLHRRAEGKAVLGVSGDCTFSPADFHRDQADVLALLADAKASLDVGVIGFEDTLCGAGRCATTIRSTFVYRDWDHFSYGGSEAVAMQMGLGQLLFDKAR